MSHWRAVGNGLLLLPLLIGSALGQERCLPSAAVSESGSPEERAFSTVADALAEAENLGIFAALVERADLMRLFRGAYPITLFAPTDAAFDDLDEGEIERVCGDPESLERFIRFHVLEDDIIVTPDGRLTGNGALNPVGRVLYWPDGD
ncbi:MAG: fasciclin domain-containing protein [Chloroflexota bacterium]